MRSKSLSFAFFVTAHGVSTTFAALVLGMMLGGLSPALSIFCLLFGWWRARSFVRQMRSVSDVQMEADPSARFELAEILLVGFMMFAAWKHFAWMMPLMATGGGANVTTLSLTNYGDLPFHLNLIRALAAGIDIMPANPIFAGEVLRYPFGADLYNAVWESAIGLPTSGHIFVTGMVMTFATLALLRELGGVWAIAAFFLAGGVVQTDLPTSVEWKNIFLAVWITQRGFLFALPIGLIMLLYLRPHLSGQRTLQRRAVSSIGRMWAIYPLFHAHSFIVVSVFLFALSVIDLWCVGIRGFSEYFKLLVRKNRALWWALIPATLLILHTSAGFKKSQVVHWRPLWTAPLDTDALGVIRWFNTNFGENLAGLLFGFIVLLAVQRIELNRRWWLTVTLFLSTFAFFMFVMLAPWDWDNVKVLIWPWVMIFALVGRTLERGLSEKARYSGFVVLMLAFLPGLQVIAKSWEKPQEKAVNIWSLEELSYSASVLKRVPASAVFASAGTPNHVLTYHGRLRVMGYGGHVWSHAIDPGNTEQNLNDLMQGKPNWVDAAKALHVTHIYWGPEERKRWPGEPEWKLRLPKVAEAGPDEVYEFKEQK